MLIHLAGAFDVVEIASVEAVIDFLFNGEELTTSLGVFSDIDRWRLGDDMRDLFAAFWVENMYVKDAGCGVVPDPYWIWVFVDVLYFCFVSDERVTG